MLAKQQRSAARHVGASHGGATEDTRCEWRADPRRGNAAAGGVHIDAKAPIAVGGRQVGGLRGADGQGGGHEGRRKGTRVALFVAGSDDDGHACSRSCIDGRPHAGKPACTSEAHAHDGRPLAERHDPIQCGYGPRVFAAPLVADDLHCVKSRTLCHPILLPRRDPRAMRAMPHSVHGTIQVAIAFHRGAAAHVQGGDRTPLEVLVLHVDAGVKHVDVRALSSPRTLGLTDAVQTP
mmetsp:Transcript_53311/g.137850  ORF Transcript_53311/g.137850 Transcript_53311/m.137850 type:complete len:236 (-) Transcript_53311:503-1210(-)